MHPSPSIPANSPEKFKSRRKEWLFWFSGVVAIVFLIWVWAENSKPKMVTLDDRELPPEGSKAYCTSSIYVNDLIPIPTSSGAFAEMLNFHNVNSFDADVLGEIVKRNAERLNSQGKLVYITNDTAVKVVRYYSGGGAHALVPAREFINDAGNCLTFCAEIIILEGPHANKSGFVSSPLLWTVK